MNAQPDDRDDPEFIDFSDDSLPLIGDEDWLRRQKRDGGSAEPRDAIRDDWLLDAAELLDRGDPGPTPWLVERLIVDQAITAVVGRWKTTKSYGVLDTCISIATGRAAFESLAIPEPGPVMFVNEESGEAALWRRLDYLCRGRGIDREEIRRRLFVAPNRRVKLDDRDWQEELLETGLRLKPRLFVFDPLARMKAAERDESSQTELAVVVEFLRELRDETGAGVAFVHHTGHTGEHMRGTSDLETLWETRLRWKRVGQSPEITIESEHREADAAAPFKYRLSFDGRTRSMRFEPVEDPLVQRVRDYREKHPDASANETVDALKANRAKVLEIIRELDAEGGSEPPEPPRNHPLEPKAGSGSADPFFEGGGNHPDGSDSGPVPEPRNHPFWTTVVRCPICDEEKAARVSAAGGLELVCGHPAPARDPEIPF